MRTEPQVGDMVVFDRNREFLDCRTGKMFTEPNITFLTVGAIESDGTMISLRNEIVVPSWTAKKACIYRHKGE